MCNKRRKSNSWAVAHDQASAKEWVVAAEIPRLRIVSDEEWSAAHQRLQVSRERYINATRGLLNGRPPSNVVAKYLLSGLMQCGMCGASMVVRVGKHGLGRRADYVCGAYSNRGRTVCENSYRLPMDAADDAILSKTSTYVLDPEVVEGAITRALDELRPTGDSVDVRRAGLQSEMRRVEAEQEKLVDALAVAGNVEALGKGLREREQQRVRLAAELAMLDSAAQITAMDLKTLERDLRKRLNSGGSCCADRYPSPGRSSSSSWRSVSPGRLPGMKVAMTSQEW